MSTLYKALSKEIWDRLTDEEKSRETQRWFDSRGKVHRMFINEYGIEEYNRWRQSQIAMSKWEREYRRLHNIHPLDTAPVWDEYGKDLY